MSSEIPSLQRVDQPPEVMVGVLEESGVDLHLTAKIGRMFSGVSSQAGISRTRGQLGILGDHAELLLTREDLFAQLVPALIELALVLVGPLLRHVVRRVAGAGREVDEERLVGHQRLLLRVQLIALLVMSSMR